MLYRRSLSVLMGGYLLRLVLILLTWTRIMCGGSRVVRMIVVLFIGFRLLVIRRVMIAGRRGRRILRMVWLLLAMRFSGLILWNRLVFRCRLLIWTGLLFLVSGLLDCRVRLRSRGRRS